MKGLPEDSKAYDVQQQAEAVDLMPVDAVLGWGLKRER